MRSRLFYLLAIWTATVGMLLSTVMMHHHHYQRICMVEQECLQDGHVNDEHTSHHDNEQDGCQIHQMHHFFTNAKLVKGIDKNIFLGGHLLTAFFSSHIPLALGKDKSLEGWCCESFYLPDEFLLLKGRRGPPCLL